MEIKAGRKEVKYDFTGVIPINSHTDYLEIFDVRLRDLAAASERAHNDADRETQQEWVSVIVPYREIDIKDICSVINTNGAQRYRFKVLSVKIHSDEGAVLMTIEGVKL